MAVPIGPGFGKSFSLDTGFDFGPGAGFGGGGFGGPSYVPVTPLGSLEAFKGDLLVPIIAVGVALFILIIIVLAVKYALAWKLDVLDGKGKWKRSTAPAEHLEDDSMSQLANIVLSAIHSQSCTHRLLCEIGVYARDRQELPNVLRIAESFVPTGLQESLKLVRESAESSYDCRKLYPCGQADDKSSADSAKTAASGSPSSSGLNNTITNSTHI